MKRISTVGKKSIAIFNMKVCRDLLALGASLEWPLKHFDPGSLTLEVAALWNYIMVSVAHVFACMQRFKIGLVCFVNLFLMKQCLNIKRSMVCIRHFSMIFSPYCLFDSFSEINSARYEKEPRYCILFYIFPGRLSSGVFLCKSWWIDSEMLKGIDKFWWSLLGFHAQFEVREFVVSVKEFCDK